MYGYVEKIIPFLTDKILFICYYFFFWRFADRASQYFILAFNQLDAQNLFNNKFYFMPICVMIPEAV